MRQCLRQWCQRLTCAVKRSRARPDPQSGQARTLLVPTTYVSDSMTSSARRRGTVSEHVVPCRVLVDRMIMRPQDAPELLERALVLARISKLEHSLLGGLSTHHPKLYTRMLTAPIDKLASLGRQRYRAVGITLRKA